MGFAWSESGSALLPASSVLLSSLLSSFISSVGIPRSERGQFLPFLLHLLQLLATEAIASSSSKRINRTPCVARPIIRRSSTFIRIVIPDLLMIIGSSSSSTTLMVNQISCFISNINCLYSFGATVCFAVLFDFLIVFRNLSPKTSNRFLLASFTQTIPITASSVSSVLLLLLQ